MVPNTGVLTLGSTPNNVYNATVVRIVNTNTNTSLITQSNTSQQVANVLVTGTTSLFGNTDYIVASNGVVSAFANISTNSTGGITNSSFTISSVGVFNPGTSNAQVVVKAFAANGTVSNGTGATFSVGLANCLIANTIVLTNTEISIIKAANDMISTNSATGCFGTSIGFSY